jgi:hypothetical protein
MSDSEKPKVPSPLSTYDILGYLAPGGGLVIFCVAFEYWARTIADLPSKSLPSEIHTPLLTALKTILIRPAMPNLIESGSVLILLLAFSYVLGHIVASISSLVLDKILIRVGTGYPYAGLLKIGERQAERDKRYRALHRALFFWVNCALLVFYALAACRVGYTTTTIVVVVVSLAGVVALLLWASLSLGVFASTSKASEPSPEAASVTKCARLLAVPCDIISQVLAGYLHTRESFDDAFISSYAVEFKDAFGRDHAGAGTLNFWLCYLYVKEHSVECGAMLVNWLNLYSFARNVATSFYLAFCYSLLWLVAQGGRASRAFDYPYGVLIGIGLLYFVLAVGMAVRFYSLYVAYFTRFVFRAFVYLRTRESRGAAPGGPVYRMTSST